MEPAVVAILIFAGASFFFALAETALFSLTKWQVGQLAAQHPHRGKIVAQLLERPRDLLAMLALGNTFANAAMLALALRMVFNAHWALALTMLALAAFILLGCEVFPKTLAVRQPERWSLRVVWLLFGFEKISKPFYRAAQWTNAAILKKAAQQSSSSATLTDAEYHELLEMASSHGHACGLGKGNHFADHQPGPAHGARRDASAREHGERERRGERGRNDRRREKIPASPPADL
jgi:putative hemolysin